MIECVLSKRYKVQKLKVISTMRLAITTILQLVKIPVSILEMVWISVGILIFSVL